MDCKDGTDELNCTVILPRKVITAATVGSLICGLLLVIAMGCTCKLYSLRTREYRCVSSQALTFEFLYGLRSAIGQ